jgi:anthranilate synthase component 1
LNQIFDIPADLDTPTSAFLKLAPLEPRFLLESVEHGERVGRYSFIGFGDGLDVTSEGGTVTAGDSSTETDGTIRGLMDALRDALARTPQPGPTSVDVPFHGGLVGAVGFDAAYRLPGAGSGHTGDGIEMAFYAPPSII